MLRQEGVGTGLLEDGAQGQATPEQQQHAPVGVLVDVIPAGDPADGDGQDGAHGDQGIELGNAPQGRSYGLGANPQQHCGQEDEQGGLALAGPLYGDLLGADLVRQVGARHPVEQAYAHRHEDEHHRDAELQPVGEAQSHLGGGDGIGGAAHQGADPADAGAVGDAKQDEDQGAALLVNIEPLEHAEGERHHHGGGGGVADPHGERGRDGEQHYGCPAEVTLGQLHHLGGDLGIQPLLGEGRRQGKAAEEEEEDRVGEVGQRLAHVKHPEQGGEHRDGQGRDGDVHRFGQPEDGDEDQDAEAFVDHGIKRKPGEHGTEQQNVQDDDPGLDVQPACRGGRDCRGMHVVLSVNLWLLLCCRGYIYPPV
ncbi:hypothetical protein D3C72_1281570 [compost metagenome]